MNGTLILTENNIDKVINLEDDLEIPIEDYPGEHESCGPDCDINHSHHPHNEEEIINCEKCDTDESDCDIEDCECECHDDEEEISFNINQYIKENDFLIILKTDEQDINFIIPQIENFDVLSDQIKSNFAQNQFFMGYINHALNNEKWIEEYASSVNKISQEFLDDFFENYDKLNDLIKNNIDVKEEEKFLDFEEEFKKLNQNKPKIIT